MDVSYGDLPGDVGSIGGRRWKDGLKSVRVGVDVQEASGNPL